SRRGDLAIGSYRIAGVVASLRMNADRRGGRLTEHDKRGASIDDEVDEAPLDPRLDLEVTLAIAFHNQAAAGGHRLARLVDRLGDRCLIAVRLLFDSASGGAGGKPAGNEHRGGKNE